MTKTYYVNKIVVSICKNHYTLSEKQLNKIIILDSKESSIQLRNQPQKFNS